MDEQRGIREGPIYLRIPLGSWGAAYLAAIGVVARLIQAGRGGGAGSVSTSLVQGALLPAAMPWRRAEHAPPALVDRMCKALISPPFECRSEERRTGNACVSPCRSRCATYPTNKNSSNNRTSMTNTHKTH